MGVPKGARSRGAGALVCPVHWCASPKPDPWVLKSSPLPAAQHQIPGWVPSQEGSWPLGIARGKPLPPRRAVAKGSPGQPVVAAQAPRVTLATWTTVLLSSSISSSLSRTFWKSSYVQSSNRSRGTGDRPADCDPLCRPCPQAGPWPPEQSDHSQAPSAVIPVQGGWAREGHQGALGKDGDAHRLLPTHQASECPDAGSSGSSLPTSGWTILHQLPVDPTAGPLLAPAPPASPAQLLCAPRPPSLPPQTPLHFAMGPSLASHELPDGQGRMSVTLGRSPQGPSINTRG